MKAYMKALTLEVTPVPKPRQTRSDKWKKRPSVMRYRAFADAVRLMTPKDIDLNGTTVTFHMPMPKSWSKKKKAEKVFTPHMQRPDIDNLAKSLLDAIYGDDSHIHTITIKKIWYVSGKIRIKFPDKGI